MSLDGDYDVIIAGAGPAGCVLASRLSEHAEKRVLLIEAGPDAVPGAEHPDIRDTFPLSSSNPALHWPNLTAEAGADIGDGSPRSMRRYIKGYGVGGGSNVNGMAADRGLPLDFNEWRDVGAQSWGWDEVLPYFKKMENDLDFSATNRAMHGSDGPMPVHRLPPSRWAPFTAAICDAMKRRGFKFIEDYVTDFGDGFSGVPTNSLAQGRVSASMAYLSREVRSRPNLTVQSNARADRVSLQGACANGLFVNMGGETKLIRGGKVIISCGAIHSPALLMRSGIGPAEHLRNKGIDIVRNMRGVGANLQNHPCVSMAMYLPRAAFQSDDNPWFLQNWLRFSSHHLGCSPQDMHLMQFNRTAWHALGKRVGMVAVTVLQSLSKGRVELVSADPAVLPLARFNLLADSRDFERLVAGLRFTLELLTDPGVASMRSQIFYPRAQIVANLAHRNSWNRLKAHAIAWLLDRGPLRRVLLAKSRIDPQVLLNDEHALRDFVRRNAHPQVHDCGTCRMGRAEDADAVVDGTGRVHGIEELHVVDASIFPTVPRGYPHFIILMMAEKIAAAMASQWTQLRRARQAASTSFSRAT